MASHQICHSPQVTAKIEKTKENRHLKTDFTIILTPQEFHQKRVQLTLDPFPCSRKKSNFYKRIKNAVNANWINPSNCSLKVG